MSRAAITLAVVAIVVGTALAVSPQAVSVVESAGTNALAFRDEIARAIDAAVPMDRVSAAYLKAIDTYFPNMSDRMLFLILAVGAHNITFWLLNGLLFICYRFDLFPQWQLQPHKLPDRELVKNCLRHLVFHHAVVVPLVAYYGYTLFASCGTVARAPLPPASVILGDFITAVAINDTGFYWTHRLLHHPRIYKHIHKKHHQFHVTVGIGAEWAHPLEDAVSNVIPTIAGCMLRGSHAAVFALWLALRMWETIDVHSGYRFPFSPWTQLTALAGGNGSERHDFHHSHNEGCFGSIFVFWDWAMGTDRAFNRWRAGRAAEAGAKKAE